MSNDEVFGLLFLGVAGTNDVLQTNIIWARISESVTINCSHTKDALHNQMYWYSQQQGESLKLIVFTTSYKTVEFGQVKENKYSASKTVPESGSLTIQDVEAADSAVYFCAVSKHSDVIKGQSCTRTSTPDLPTNSGGQCRTSYSFCSML